MSNKIVFSLFLILLSTAVYSMGNQDNSDSFTIVTSTSIIDDVVRQVAGDSAEIYNLMGKGNDPHSYEPTPRDMAKVERASLVFTNGLGLEENLLSVLETVHGGEIVEVSGTIDLMEAVDHEEGEDHEEGDHDADEDHHADDHEGSDPHSWMSPLNVLKWVDVIEAALTKADPAHDAEYRENAENYRKELRLLDSWIREELAVLPESKRVLVTDHNVFSYFARDYQFRIIGTIIPGFSSNAEPSAGELSRLISILEAQQVNALFIDEAAGEGVLKLAGTLNEESEYDISVYTIISGSLRNEGEPGDSYLSFMKYNVNQIISGLSE